MIVINILLKLLIGLALILIIFKFIGNKEMSNVTPVDMIFLVIIADLVGGISMDPELKYYHLIIVMIGWTLYIYVLEKITEKSKKVSKAIEGDPVLIIHDGAIIHNAMERENMSEKELKALLREQGVFDIERVDMAYIEVSGNLSVKTKDD